MYNIGKENAASHLTLDSMLQSKAWKEICYSAIFFFTSQSVSVLLTFALLIILKQFSRIHNWNIIDMYLYVWPPFSHKKDWFLVARRRGHPTTLSLFHPITAGNLMGYMFVTVRFEKAIRSHFTLLTYPNVYFRLASSVCQCVGCFHQIRTGRDLSVSAALLSWANSFIIVCFASQSRI